MERMGRTWAAVGKVGGAEAVVVVFGTEAGVGVLGGVVRGRGNQRGRRFIMSG